MENTGREGQIGSARAVERTRPIPAIMRGGRGHDRGHAQSMGPGAVAPCVKFFRSKYLGWKRGRDGIALGKAPQEAALEAPSQCSNPVLGQRQQNELAPHWLA